MKRAGLSTSRLLVSKSQKVGGGPWLHEVACRRSIRGFGPAAQALRGRKTWSMDSQAVRHVASCAARLSTRRRGFAGVMLALMSRDKLSIVVLEQGEEQVSQKGVDEALSLCLLANGGLAVRQTRDASYSFRWMKHAQAASSLSIGGR